MAFAFLSPKPALAELGHHEPPQIIERSRTDGSVFRTEVTKGIAYIAGAEVHFTHEKPEDCIDETPLIIKPGFLGIKLGYRRLREEIASQGRPAVSYAPPRTQSWQAFLRPDNLAKAEMLTSKAGWGVERFLKRRGLADQFDEIGHSMGGPTAVRTAYNKSHSVRSVTLVGAAGLETMQRRTLSMRFPGFLAFELAPALPQLAQDADLIPAAKHVANYLFRNPLLTFSEVWDVSRAQVHEPLAALSDPKHDVKTVVIAMMDDRLFDAPTMESEVGDLVRKFEPVEGNHLSLQTEPERMARIIVSHTTDSELLAA